MLLIMQVLQAVKMTNRFHSVLPSGRQIYNVCYTRPVNRRSFASRSNNTIFSILVGLSVPKIETIVCSTCDESPFFKYFSKLTLSIFLIELICYKLPDFPPLLTFFSSTVSSKFLNLLIIIYTVNS